MDSILLRNLVVNGSPVSPSSTRNRSLTNPLLTPIQEVQALKLNNTSLTATQDGDLSDRRKFYIVQNGESPAEMYCTDLVHKAKHGHSRLRNVDESRLMKCIDRWRPEWNHGVQMPLLRDRPAYCFENINLFPKLETVNFQQPKKCVALNKKRYTKNSFNFEVQAHPHLYQYEIDNADEEWLNSNENSHLKHLDFLNVINELEIDCYKNIHTALLERLTFARDNSKTDDDADCDICCMPEWEPGDEIVFCDNCNISVHQSCYGLDALPTDDWMCATCVYHTHLAQSGDELPPPCMFCPILGGAMKCTKNADTWAHVICALWIPEVRFGDVERREPITHVSDIPADRWQAKCTICDTCHGACIRCTYPNCNLPFHVSCAQRSGLSLQIEQNLEAKNGVSMISLCSKHSPSSPNCQSNSHSGRRSSSGTSNFDRSQLFEMTQNFYKFVNLNKIGEICNISQQSLNLIFTYWRRKRKMNGCQSLMVEPIDIKISVQPKRIQPPQTVRPKTNTFSHLPSDQLLEGFEKIRAIRLNLEKARNLCYMVSRREKLKKAHLETFEHSNLTMCSILLNSVVPLSTRRAEKLIETWDSTTKEILSMENQASSSNSALNNIEEMDHFNLLQDFNTLHNSSKHENQFVYEESTQEERPNGLIETYDLRNGYHHSQHALNSAKSHLLTSSQKNLSPNNATTVNVGRNGRNLSDERKRREEMYVFRSSNSPLPIELPPAKSDDKTSYYSRNVSTIDMDGNVSDASNFTEYSVAWSNTSESNGTLFDFENRILSVRLKNGRKKKPLNGKLSQSNVLNGELKLKKVNLKDERKKSGFNGWKNSTNTGGYVLHHPELAIPARRVSRSGLTLGRRIV